MKIGIFGGTFNPPHLGHLIVAEHVREGHALDRVIFIPSATPPHKQHLTIADASARLEMVRLAVAGHLKFEVSDIEIARGGVSYTVDTLLHLRANRPHDSLVLLLGMDNLREFTTWKSPEQVVDLATVLVMTRPGASPAGPWPDYFARFAFCQVPEIGISSSVIRDHLRVGRSIRYLVPESVVDYIRRKGLYR